MRPEETWEPVPLATPLRWLGGGTRLVARGTDSRGADTWLAVEVGLGEDGTATLRHSRLFDRPTRAGTSRGSDPDTTVADALIEATGVIPNAAGIATFVWPGERPDRVVRDVAGAATSAVLAVALELVAAGVLIRTQPTFFEGAGVPDLLIVGTIITVALTYVFELVGIGGHLLAAVRRVSARAGHLSPTLRDRLGHPLSRARAEELLPPPEAPAGPTPAERVDRIKSDYGALLTDIAYRIENSALFDASVPHTQRFQVALLMWQDATTSGADLATAASEVEESFALARAEAERQGLDHLPDRARDRARTAAHAARLALTTSESGEREAAARRAADILDGLALYYLPMIDPRVPSLVGERKAIEP